MTTKLRPAGVEDGIDDGAGDGDLVGAEGEAAKEGGEGGGVEVHGRESVSSGCSSPGEGERGEGLGDKGEGGNNGGSAEGGRSHGNGDWKSPSRCEVCLRRLEGRGASTVGPSLRGEEGWPSPPAPPPNGGRGAGE